MGRAHKGSSAADCPREADLPQNLAGKSGLPALPHPADVRLPCGSHSGLPTNCGTPFSTLPESLTSLTVHLRAHLCSPAYPPLLKGTRRIRWELSGILMGTKGFCWVIVRKKRNLVGIFLELDEIKGFWWDIGGNKRNLMGTVWELDGKSSPHPFKKIRNRTWGMFAPPNWLIPSKNTKPWCSLHALF